MEPKPRIGVYICHCGTNIAATVDVEAVTGFAATLPNVVVASSPANTPICAPNRGRLSSRRTPATSD